MSAHTPAAQRLQIAPSKSAFDNALFTPGGTFDGYVRRIVKGGIRLFVMGENYTLNREDVFCLETKQTNGRTWFSYGGRLNERTMGQLADLADSIRALAKARAELALAGKGPQ